MASAGTNKNIDDLFARDKFNIDEFSLKIANAINDNYSELQNKLHKEWEQWYKDYKDIKDPIPFGSKRISNHSVQVTSTQIDGIVTRLEEDLFGYNEPIQMYPLGVGAEDELAAINGNKIMRWDIESNEDLRTNIWHYIKGAGIYGLSFAYTFFEQEQEEIEEEIQVINVNGEVIESDEEVIQNLELNQIPYQIENRLIKKMKWKKYSPKTINLNRKNVCWNIDALNIEDAFENGFVAIQIERTLDQIYREVKNNPDNKLFNYDNLLKIKDKLQDKNIKNYKSKKIKFWLYFSKDFINDEDEFESQIVALFHLDSKTIIGLEKYTYDHGECPVVVGFINPNEFILGGTGIAETLYPSKKYLDDMRNIMADNRMFHNFPIRQHTRRSGFNSDIHHVSLGAVWELDDLNEMKIEQVQPLHGDLWTEFNEVKNEVAQRFGMSELAFGGQPDSGMTYRGMMQLLEEGSKSRGMFKKWISQGIQKIFYQRYRLYKQYWGVQATNTENEEQNQQVREWLNYILENMDNKFEIDAGSLEALNYNFNVVLKATNEDRKEEMLKTRDKYELLIKDPNVQQSFKHVRKLHIDVLAASGDRDPEGSYPTEEELMQQRVEVEKEAQAQLLEEQNQREQEKLGEAEYNKELGRSEVKASMPVATLLAEATNNQ